jgi:4-hydroxy-4-methyl-2-oxoglutarate aldolase
MRLPALLCLFASAISAQVFTFTKEQMIRYTAQNPFDRFPDGRPKAPDELIEKLKALSMEEVWSVLPRAGYPCQYADGFRILHPGRKLVGRAVTAQFMPVRADVNQIIAAEGKAKGYQGGQNQWVIDQLQPGDVLVVDLFGKIDGGTFIGDNLAYYIMKKTGTGLVVDGGIRDLEGIASLDLQIYFRGAHPSAINNLMLTGFNVPVRIGGATVMPGDLVLGDREGVYFIPPQLLAEVLERAAVSRVHDEWTRMKFDEGKYKSSDIYGSPRDPALKKEYEEYRKKKLGK